MRIRRLLLLILILVAVRVNSGYATTFNAASCSQTDVQAAIGMTSAGDTVIVPAGTCTWTSLTITGISLIGQHHFISGSADACTGTADTTIQGGTVTINKHATQITRLSGFRFTDSAHHVVINSGPTNRAFVIDNNCFFNDPASGNPEYMTINSNGGLFHHNDWPSATTNGGPSLGRLPLHPNEDWSQATTMGMDDTQGPRGGERNIYFEDNTFTNWLSGSPDGDQGARVVFRHNIFNDSGPTFHAGNSVVNDTSQYGVRHAEIYDNTFNRLICNNNINEWIWYRGSSGVVARNTFADINTFGCFGGKDNFRLAVGCSNVSTWPIAHEIGQTVEENPPFSFVGNTPTQPLLVFGNTGPGTNSTFPAIIENATGQGAPYTSCSNPTNWVQEGRDYYLNRAIQPWSWTSFTYPHPLASPIPTLVQHVATGIDQNPVGVLTMSLPNPVGAGNALIMGIQFGSSGSIASVADDKGNAWTLGPTTTNNTFSHKLALYYALNAISGTQTITVTFNGAPSFPQAVISEFYNVATASAADGSSSNSSSVTAGSITTALDGDLIFHWAADMSDTYVNGGAYNGTSITAGNNFTLLSADLQVGSSDQYQIQSTHGAINPTMTVSGSSTWASLAIAFKAASAGTPPPAGIRIVHIQHTLLAAPGGDVGGGGNQGRATPIIMQFPSSGNLLAGLFTGGANPSISSVVDSANNTWVNAATELGNNLSAQIVYAANATTSSTLHGITVTLANEPSAGGITFDLYDITGAATSPFDKATVAMGNQTSSGNVTTASLTPATANGLVLNVVAIDFHDLGAIVGAGYVTDNDYNSLNNDAGGTNGTPNSTMSEDNGMAHIYNPNTSAVTFVYSTYGAGSPSGIQTWAAVDAAFKTALGDNPIPGNSGVITSSNITATSLTLTWTAATDPVDMQSALQYEVCQSSSNNISTVSGCEGATIIQAFTTNITTKNVSSLSSNTTYFFNVVVRNTAGNKSIYVAASDKTLDNTFPVVGNGGAITLSNFTSSSITLTWTAATDPDDAQNTLLYEICQSTSNILATINGCENNLIVNFTTNIVTKTATGLAANTTYYFDVVVEDTAGNKSIYTTASGNTIDSTAPTPGNSGILSFSAIGPTTVTVNWIPATDPDNAQNTLLYEVFRSLSSVGPTVANCEAATLVQAYTTNITTVTVNGLAPSMTYFFCVDVRDVSNNASPYTPSSVSTPSSTTPPIGGGRLIIRRH